MLSAHIITIMKQSSACKNMIFMIKKTHVNEALLIHESFVQKYVFNDFSAEPNSHAQKRKKINKYISTIMSPSI